MLHAALPPQTTLCHRYKNTQFSHISKVTFFFKIKGPASATKHVIGKQNTSTECHKTSNYMFYFSKINEYKWTQVLTLKENKCNEIMQECNVVFVPT